jgi:hypothetical protein
MNSTAVQSNQTPAGRFMETKLNEGGSDKHHHTLPHEGNNSMAEMRQSESLKPCAMLGTGQLVSNLWKFPDDQGGWRYRFNIYRMSGGNGHVSQLLRPVDVQDLVKLCQVLAATLANDDYIPAEQQYDLADLSVKLDSITRTRI